VRFLLDHDVDAAVGRMLRRHGHECLMASQIGLAAATDDALTVWVDRVLMRRDRGKRQHPGVSGCHSTPAETRAAAADGIGASKAVSMTCISA
jgi:hypothetical protein